MVERTRLEAFDDGRMTTTMILQINLRGLMMPVMMHQRLISVRGAEDRQLILLEHTKKRRRWKVIETGVRVGVVDDT